MFICWCTIKVSDLEKSEDFYRNVVGMELVQKFSPAPGTTISFFKGEEGAEIELISTEGGSKGGGSGALSIGLMTSDLDKALERMKAHQVEILRGPLTLGKDMRCFFVKDPDGVELQIVAKG